MSRRTIQEVIEIHDSDSEPEDAFQSRAKRHKPAHVAATMDDIIAGLKRNNVALKGRKRFMADLDDAKAACKSGFAMGGLRVIGLRLGEDGESTEFTVLHDNQHLISIALFTDPSEYPGDHTFFGSSSDSNVAPRIQAIIEGIYEHGSVLICEALQKILASLSRLVVKSTIKISQADSDEEMEDDEDDVEDLTWDDDDDNFGLSGAKVSSTFNLERVHHDFLETAASDGGYRPGLLRFSADDLALSVSRQVIKLAEEIPPRALMAWDRRLLSRAQHLTLLISGMRGVYPVLAPDGTYTREAAAKGAALKFKVGLSERYKPGVDQAREAARHFALVEKDEAEPEVIDAAEDFEMDEPTAVEEEEEPEPGRFDRFGLSASLEALLNGAFVRVVQLRLQFKLGWAGAELLHSEVERTQCRAEDVYAAREGELLAEDVEERRLAQSYALPHDALAHHDAGAPLNLPLLAFAYLVRRLALCPRYCLVCHNKIRSEYDALKPYVCESKLCTYQYYHLNLGTALEYEICANPGTVDLLLSLTYSAAAEGVLDEPLPVGMGLRVPAPKSAVQTLNARNYITGQQPAEPPAPPPLAEEDGLCDFDTLALPYKRAAIKMLIDSLPAIADLKRHLEKRAKAGKSQPKLKDYVSDQPILPAAWVILRWCMGSCTAHLEEVTAEEDMVKNIDASWRQFRFAVGAPDAEAKFDKAVALAKEESGNAKNYPSLLAFHGSPLRNWHSIIRHGLWFSEKNVIHGRAYGHGVYFAKEGTVSMGSYAVAAQSGWRNSASMPSNACALAEIVNLPEKFVSQTPYFVVAQTEWIICRYLLVKCSSSVPATPRPDADADMQDDTPYIRLDPAHPLTMSSTKIKVPEPSHRINNLLTARKVEQLDEDYDEDDQEVFAGPKPEPDVIEISDDEDYRVEPKGKGKEKEEARAPVEDDWEHDAEWVQAAVDTMLPPPADATPMATMSLQKELKFMLKEQEKARSLKELGWYMPPEFMGDNLFQWIVELHSFEEELPIAQDMKAKGVNSLIFEIRFPPNFPHSPPFFRILRPRFLPFIQGGGGHVTGGGSMCMDLLTADGWLPSYSISAVLLQIKLAISNLDPRPARLARNWDHPYAVYEALEGYKRAANTHGWTVPVGLDKLVR